MILYEVGSKLAVREELVRRRDPLLIVNAAARPDDCALMTPRFPGLDTAPFGTDDSSIVDPIGNVLP
jgi:hypothetical protein